MPDSLFGFPEEHFPYPSDQDEQDRRLREYLLSAVYSLEKAVESEKINKDPDLGEMCREDVATSLLHALGVNNCAFIRLDVLEEILDHASNRPAEDAPLRWLPPEADD